MKNISKIVKFFFIVGISNFFNNIYSFLNLKCFNVFLGKLLNIVSIDQTKIYGYYLQEKIPKFTNIHQKQDFQKCR